MSKKLPKRSFGKMKKIALITTICITLALVSMPLTALAAGGQPIARTFSATHDSYVDLNSVDTTHDSGATTMNVQSRSGKDMRSYIKFDVSTIPSGSTSISATLTLINSAFASGRTYEVYRVTEADWDEASITWTNQPDTNLSLTGSTSTATTMVWTVTTDIVAWVGGTTNYGWCIKDSIEGRAGGADITSFYTDESTTNKPVLSVTYTAPWDSYNKAYSSILETYTGTEDTISMKGTGFANGDYIVRYYDALDVQVGSDAGINISGGQDLQSNLACNTDTGAEPGLWDAKVWDSPLGTTLIAHDTFTVQSDVIPEFPTIFAAIGVAGLCFGIYYWMKRRLVYVKA